MRVECSETAELMLSYLTMHAQLRNSPDNNFLQRRDPQAEARVVCRDYDFLKEALLGSLCVNGKHKKPLNRARLFTRVKAEADSSAGHVLAVSNTPALFCSCGLLTPEKSQRSKRGLLELAGAIKCSTGRSALSYMMYGCYCGLGGRGWPRDRADWCCHRHDCCYGTAEFAGCRTMTDRYDWTCEDRVPDCDSLKDRCERILCQCDREAAKCLRKAPFIRKYAVWPDFLCGCEYPTCSFY